MSCNAYFLEISSWTILPLFHSIILVKMPLSFWPFIYEGGLWESLPPLFIFLIKNFYMHNPPQRQLNPRHLLGHFWSKNRRNFHLDEIFQPALKNLHQICAKSGLFFCFNCLWPLLAYLEQWIHSSCTKSCKVIFCSKGFFIVAIF